MKVILLENVENLGNRGSIVRVKNGYARNFLVPHSMALEATPGNIKVAEQKKKHFEVQLIKEKSEAEELAKKIAGLSCTVVKKVGEGETLYGSVTNSEIAAALETEGITIDKRKIEMADTIKNLGVFDIPVKVHPEVTATLKVWVVKE